MIIKKFKNQPNIVIIKNKYLIQEKCSLQPVSVKDVENFIKNVPSNKAQVVIYPFKYLRSLGLLSKF